MKSMRSVFVKTAFMLVLTSASNSFAATQTQEQYSIVNESAGNIRFVSIEGEMLVFELRLNNLLPKGSMLRIMDGENNLIYEERTSVDTYNIRYKIVRNDISKINFEISNKVFFLTQSFNVNSRTTETVEVTKA